MAHELGVSRQALYYHFRSKGEILGALFDQLMTQMEVAATVAAPADEEPMFNAMIRAHIEVTVADPRLMALLLHERPEIAKLDGIRATARRRDYARLFMHAYQEGVERGALRPVDPWIAVNTLLAAINGVSWWFHGESGHNSSSPVDIRDRLYETLAEGFLLTGGSGARTAAGADQSASV